MEAKTVMVATDFSKPADLALDAGIHWASRVGAQVKLLHIFDSWKESLAEAHAELAERAHRVNSLGLDCVCEVVSRRSNPPSPLEVARHHADWLFLGTQGRSGVARVAVGSWAEAAIRRARCPVVTVPHDAVIAKDLSTIVVGIDLSEASGFVLEHLRSIGNRLGCSRFVLAHAQPAPADMIPLFREQGTPLPPADLGAAAKDLDELVQGVREDGYEATLVTSCEGSADLILRVAREEHANMIAVGTHGRRGFPHLLFGSVAMEVVRSADCPVLIGRAVPERWGRE